MGDEAVTSAAAADQSGSPPSNLPLQATELIGRERDTARALDELSRPDVRVLTLTGPAGTGKTRLALEVARRALREFPGGVFFVDVSPLTDAPLVVSAIAQALGVRLPAGDDGMARLKEWLGDRRLLLLLDNFEQALAAAPQLADLVAGSPGVNLMVTSRAALRLRWEHELPVAPLALPDLQHLPDLETLGQTPSVALFVERGHAVKPDFGLSAQNASAVAELCVRLDGLPLALELAAARLKVLSPRVILERLQGRLDLLAPGAQDQPARHHTLRGALDWSYELLTAQEQRLLRGLSVFVGGWNLDAAEAVCANDSVPQAAILDLLAQLVDRSLVVADISPDGAVRYRLLETIRQYANELAARQGEAAEAAFLHAAHFDALVEQAERHLQGSNARVWLERLAQERDNLRAALRWSAENGRTEQGVRLGSALWEAMEFVLAEAESARPEEGQTTAPRPSVQSVGPLSPREREVAVLLARGATNKQIAESLVIAEGTAERHVANILNKLSLTSRAQVAVWAVEHGLLAEAGAGPPWTSLA